MKTPVLISDLLKDFARLHGTKWPEDDCPFCYGTNKDCDFHALQDDGGGNDEENCHD